MRIDKRVTNVLMLTLALVSPVLGTWSQPVFAQTAFPTFIDIAPDLGINLVSTDYGPNPVDYNQDGLLDLMFANHFDSLLLYEQQSTGTFVDVAASVGIPGTGWDMHGAAWGDCDNDGYLDLYISVGTQASVPNLLFHNLGNNTFEEIAEQAGVPDALARGRGASWIDYNNDGNLDLFLTNGSLSGTSDVLFRNDGSCSFTNVTSLAGDLTSRFHKYGMSWADYDDDGDMDVFATSGGCTENLPDDCLGHLYRNNGDGTFTNVTTSVGIREEASMGMAWGDYDNDADLDLFVSTPRGNRLYRNGGSPGFTFSDIAESAGVTASNNSQEAMWADFDNDGDLDLYVVNAGPREGPNPANYLYENLGGGDFQEIAVSVGARGVEEGMSGGGAIADIDADGFLDIVLTHGLSTYGRVPGPREVLNNQSNENQWLQVQLVGEQSNSLGIGARVELSDQSGQFLQMREANGGTHNYSQDEMLLNFGLGSLTTVPQLTVYWPSGITQVLNNVPAGQRLTIVEDGFPPPQADLAVVKSDAVDPVTEGDGVTYSVTVTNDGPDTALNVVLTDDLPTGVTFLSATPTQGSCSESGGVVSCDLGDLASGVSADVTIMVATTSYGVLTNSASVASDTADPNAANDSDAEDTTVESSNPPTEIIIDNLDPEFSTEGSWGVGEWATWLPYDGSLAYDRLRASGSRATFTPEIPASGQYEVFVWQMSCSRYCATNAPFTVNHADGSNTIPIDQSDTSLAGQWISLGTFTFNAGTSGSIVLTDDADGRVLADAVRLGTAGPPPPTADLAVVKSDAVDPVTEGDDVTYTVVLTNNGPDTAHNVVLSDDLPTGVTFLSATPTQGSCAESGGVVTCDLGDLASGASADVSILVNAPTAGTLTNSASASSDTADPNAANDNDAEDTTVEGTPVPQADLAVVKSDAVDPVTEGDDVTYTVVVTNDGPDAAENVVLSDDLPSGVTFVSATPTQGSCSESGGVVTCDLGDLTSGASADISILVNAPTAGNLTNSASASSDTADPNAANDSDTEDTTVESSTPPTEIIIDNLDPEFSTEGNWATGDWATWLPYEGSLAYDRRRVNTERATFTPSIPASGEYEVFVWQMSCSRFCATNAPFTVNHADGSNTIPIDQSDTGLAGQWISVGTFTFNAGTSGSIVLTDDADGRVLADAVRLVPR